MSDEYDSLDDWEILQAVDDEGEGLTEWEINFVESMWKVLDQGAMSADQRSKLIQIANDRIS